METANIEKKTEIVFLIGKWIESDNIVKVILQDEKYNKVEFD